MEQRWNNDEAKIMGNESEFSTLLGDRRIEKFNNNNVVQQMNRIYRNKRSGAQAGRRTFCTPMARFMSSKARIDIRSFGIKGSVWKTTVSSPSVKSSESFQKPEEKEEEETIETQQIRI